MQALRLVRHEKTAFDGRFHERGEAFAAIARGARLFADRTEWPLVEDYNRLFEGRIAPVRFEEAPPKRRRSGDEPIARDTLYDAMIVRRRIVPTRARMWHDYLNALVWASFPNAKLALHERQHRAIDAWIPEGATRLPNARTRELDALALVDEGGILVVENGSERYEIVFGHALLEGAVLDNRAMIARGVMLDATSGPHRSYGDVPALPSDIDARVALADDLLASALRMPGRIVAPNDLPRVRQG